MGIIADAFRRVYRDFATDGVAGSGKHEPPKADIRDIGKVLDEAIGGIAAGLLPYATKAAMDADLARPAGTLARVYSDGANNGVYSFVGGAWTRDASYYEGVAAVVEPRLAAMEGEVAAAEAAADAVKASLSVAAVETVGRPLGATLTLADPVVAAQVFFLDRVAHKGTLESIDIFDRGAGAIEVAVFHGSGSAVARTAFATVASQGGNVERRLAIDPPLTVDVGDVLCLRAASDGLYSIIAPAAADGAGYYLGPTQPIPAEVTLGGASTNLLIQVRLNITYHDQKVTADALAAIDAQLAPLYADRAALIGRPAGAPIVDAQGALGAQIFFMDAIPKAGRVETIDIYDRAAGSIEVAAFRAIGGVWTRIGMSSASTQGGGVARQLPILSPFAVEAGDIACIRGTADGLFSVAGGAPADGTGCYLGPIAPIPATAEIGAARTDVLIYARLHVVSRELAVTADAFDALKDEVQEATHGGSPRLPLSAAVRLPLLTSSSWWGLVANGQSNSTAYEAKPALSTAQMYSARTFGGGVATGKAGNGYGAVVTGAGMSTSKPLVEMDTSSSAPGADGSTMNGETALTAAAAAFVELAAAIDAVDPKSIVVFASSAGHAGYSITQLSKGAAWYQSVIDHIGGAAALAHANGRTYVPPVIYWCQGEDDAKSGTSTAAYLAALLQLVADINADAVAAITGAAPGRPVPTTPVHFLLSQTASPYFEGTRANLNLVQQAQYLASRQSPLIHYIAPLSAFDPVEGGLHLSAVSQRRMGAYIGRAMADLIVDQCEPDALWPVSAVASGQMLRIRYRVPTLPIVIDELTFGTLPDQGFVVRDAAGVVPIVSVAVGKSGDVVELALGRAPGSDAVVRQGMDYIGATNRHLRSSSTCLRDSTTATSNGLPLWHVAPACEMPIAVIRAGGAQPMPHQRPISA
ncbi:hypothetical protein [Sphingomonas sp. VNH70]|uniref:hypothetical protein n=1 Tax=Sphingomonas silueang TaxID=3156617 RepID=UPI0032B56175